MKRKHFVKRLMGYGLSRNIANNFALQLQVWRIPYSECIITGIYSDWTTRKMHHYELEFKIPDKYITNIVVSCKVTQKYNVRITYPLFSKHTKLGYRKLGYRFTSIEKLKFKFPIPNIWWLRSPYSGASTSFFRVGEQHYGLQKSWLV